MAQEWITDRLPTEADGDGDGDVRIRRAPGSDVTRLTHWSYVQADMDWQRSSFWQPPADPDPVEPTDGGVVEPNIGDAYGGGYFAGYISHTADGVATHRLIVAPRLNGATGTGYTISTDLRCKTAASSTTGSTSQFDGAANTAAMPDRIAALEQRVAESIHALEQRLSSLEQLFWAHKHEAQPVSIPAEAQP